MFVYFTAIWTHHQEGVCRELHKLLGDGFKMVLTLPLDAPLSRERMAMGWNLIPPDEDWIVGPPKTEAEARAIDYAPYVLAPEVAVFGYVPFLDERLIMRRVRSGKLTFFQGERFFKKPRRLADWFNPRVLKHWLCIWRKLHPKNVHYLAMNHWCADDLRFFHVCKGRTWQWGYLTEVSTSPVEKPMRTNVRIGWCGRFLCLKNVCDILQATALLENSVKDRIEIVLVGEGPEKENLVRLSRELGLDGIVEFKPFLAHKEAVSFIESVDIFPFTSNREEGWGAILPEAMDKCCAVVANEEAGSTLVLVTDGENGFTYKAGDMNTLARRIAALVEDGDLRHKFGFAAWQTMQNWSPHIGAERLIAVASALSGKGSCPEYDCGLMSLRR